jgi:D-alanine-D-alanine ligase
MKNIAILTGGDSAERVISLQSGRVVYDHLDKDRYNVYLIDIEGADWKDLSSGFQIDKNDFTIPLPDGEKIRFDCAFAALHGSPLEDGKMQGYFDMLGLPYTCCDGYVSGLTMNKHHTKLFLAPFGVPVAKSVLLRRDAPVDTAKLLEMGLPLFVKPNTHGSSFGITKVNTAAALLPAIEAVWPYDKEALVEAFLAGREFSDGVLRVNGEVLALPVTEIIPESDFFDFAAKYEGKSKEITPADLQPELEQQCRERSRQLYEILHCKGVVRFDYILVGDVFYLLEANSIPGISPASIVPQQAQAHGWDLGVFFGLLVEEAMGG